jgi:hypothetical protein
MKAFKIFLIAAAINFLCMLGFLLAINYGRINQEFVERVSLFSLAYSLIPSGLGWLLGAIVNGLLVYPKKKQGNYIRSQVVGSILLFMAITFIAGYWDTRILKYADSRYTNTLFTDDGYTTGPQVIQNTEPVADTLAPYQRRLTRGFKAFTAGFRQTDVFYLKNSYEENIDTTINTVRDSLHVYYFTYAYALQSDKQWFSKVAVWKDSAFVEIQKGDPELDPSYEKVVFAEDSATNSSRQ